MHYLTENWLIFTATIDLAIALVTSSHVVLTKRDTRAAIGWVGLVWFAPLVGSLLYWWLGVNRIQRRARRRRCDPHYVPAPAHDPPCSDDAIRVTLGPSHAYLCSLVTLLDRITKQPLLAGNRIVPLIDGDEAFPAMLAAIDSAKTSVSLSTYIFDNDAVGKLFLEALQRAVQRHVEVRVLIDDMGARYSWPTMVHALRESGVPCATFMPPLIPWKFQYTNLRSHRKGLVIDGQTGFTGGINIRAGHWLQRNPKHPVRDLHFQVDGPVVAQLQSIFTEDWLYCTGEVLSGERWFRSISSAGTVLARGIPDGPDEHFESFRHALLGAIASAETSIRVLTPYFLPDAALITALNVAALRGITVDIVLPGENNILLVQWATTSLLWQVVERGCRIWISPPPFDHAKAVVVDDVVTFIGSSNWDPRSLRLNFEFNLECYSRELAATLGGLIDERIRHARLLTLAELDGRSLAIRLRDGIARLASPYL